MVALPLNCCEIEDNVYFSLSGVYNITKFCRDCKVHVVAQGYCDASWLVVQRRKDGSVSFDRDCTESQISILEACPAALLTSK